MCRIHEEVKGDDLYSINVIKKSEEVNVLVGWCVGRPNGVKRKERGNKLIM